MKGKVFITDYVEDPYIEKEVLGELLSDKLHENIEAVLVWHEHINKAYIDQLPNLKAVVRYGVGFDAIDIPYCTSKGIKVCNTPDYGTEEVSDTAIAMIMNIARGLTRYDYLCRNYNDGTWQENTIPSLKRNSEIVLGIIGAGRIGGSVALKARALRFKVVIYDPAQARGYEKMLGTERVDSLEELLAKSDIVSIHAPLSSSTKGMVNESFVKMMKKGASFVNTARGGLIEDIDVFYDALKSGHLDCVALDVIPQEPPVSGKMIDAWKARELWLDGRFIINPHSAYYSGKAYHEMRFKAASNALRILKGEVPYNLLNG